MKKLANLKRVSVLSKSMQSTIHGGDYVMASCSDYCPGTVQGNIFTGQCTCITGE
ncbi:hypothetical protein GCM10009430_41660 [Aquimarina litoralis]|uniref:Uncharacterized protein n=1 Tax=Aquimarina litoralis TaxID=584605 RepID=A0ABN1J6S1_9FLAO